MSFLSLFPSAFWAKSRKQDEHVTLRITKDHYQFCLPSNGRILSMTLSCFLMRLFQLHNPVI